MYKFIKTYAEQMHAAAIYPMFSLLVFFIFFIVLLYFVKKMDKATINEISNIPLDLDETTTTGI